MLERTIESLGRDVVEKFSNGRFCILGCGAVGSLFAEMLVRTGATKLTLIDGDTVESSNLNRTTAFIKRDIEKDKVDVVKERLENIADNLSIKTFAYHFRKPNPSDEKAIAIKESIAAASIVIIAMDDNKSRIDCEELCRAEKTTQLSIGIEIRPKGSAFYECALDGITPDDMKTHDGGYGQGSYISIVMEATAAGFTMLINHLESTNPDDKYNYLSREFEHYRPKDLFCKWQ